MEWESRLGSWDPAGSFYKINIKSLKIFQVSPKRCFPLPQAEFHSTGWIQIISIETLTYVPYLRHLTKGQPDACWLTYKILRGRGVLEVSFKKPVSWGSPYWQQGELHCSPEERCGNANPLLGLLTGTTCSSGGSSRKRQQSMYPAWDIVKWNVSTI